MPPPFREIDVAGFRTLLADWRETGRRRADAVHLRPTQSPDHAAYRGLETIDAMWRDDARDRGRGDIVQHVTVAPDGTIWTGRHWDRSSPSPTGGQVGETGADPFVVGIVGNFDQDRDPFSGPQRDAALWLVSLLQDAFDLPLDCIHLISARGPPTGDPDSSIVYPEVENAVRALRGTKPPRRRGGTASVRRQELAAAREWLRAEPLPISEPEIDSARPDGPTMDRSSVAGWSRYPADLSAETLAGLRPYVVDLWGDRLSSGGIFKTDEADIVRIFDEELPRRLARAQDGRPLPIVLYAHGGLVPEEAGLRIAASQVPWWIANGCYPLQFVWETGLFEAIERLIGVRRALARDLSDWSDAAVERAARILGGPRIWGGMKQAAASAFDEGAAGSKLVERLVAFARNHSDRVRLHAVGHSAGSIFHAHLLRHLQALDAPPLDTLTLLAPAITVADYERLVDPLVPTRAKRVRIFTMSRDFERADTVTFAYRKSLLYLIHGALEPVEGEPILGLEDSLRADPRLARRFGLDGTVSATGEIVWSQTAATSGSHASRSTTHGGFDNDVPTMESVARGILAIRDGTPLKQPFPPDTETRAAVSPRAPDSQSPSRQLESTDMSVTSPSRPGGRRALCVGINAYPNPENRLRGCVADAEDWAAALTRLGFSVDRLHDAAATREAILNGLRALIGGSKDGDVLAFQYSGHGTHVPDLDGDEVSGQDQAICPFDFEDGELLIDDDIRAVFETLPSGVRLTCFMDNCFSYSNTRFAVGRAVAKHPDSLPRFVELSSQIVERYRAVRTGRGSRALAGTRSAGPGTPEEMRWIAFAACNSDEVAYETQGRGDFSRVAVPLLGGPLSNQQFNDRVTELLGAQPRQHPKLDCRRGDGVLPLLATGGGRAPAPEPTPVVDRTNAAADLLEAAARLLRTR